MFVDWIIQPRYRLTMVSLRRELVYSLLLAIGLLVGGLVALLWVANARERRYQDELSDLRRSLVMRDAEMQQMRQQLRQALITADSSWAISPTDTLSSPH